MAAIFLSYRHVDPVQKLATELTNYLAKHKISYFVDTQIRISEEWSRVIDRELRACESVAVFLSAESIRSDMVNQEVKLAHELSKRIFPIRVDYDGALPYDLGAYLDKVQYRIWRVGEPFDSSAEPSSTDSAASGQASPIQVLSPE
jgi:hypothetical protein